MSLNAGSRLGAYEVLGPLGAGGMGEVWRARDPRLGREVAVKVLPEEFFENEERKRRFEREARLLAALNHPGIAAIYSFEEIPSSSPSSSPARHILVMELLEGETLRERLRAGPLPPRRALDIAVQMASALAAAHEKGIVHRDLKPENVFLTRNGRVKILDFGLARATPRGGSHPEQTATPTESLLTGAHAVLGTAAYMSPEQVRGATVDHRSDFFSFGTILFEMLSGRNPFRAATTPETMTAILKEDPAFEDAAFDSAPGVALVVARCLEKEPERRFQSAQDLAFALEALSRPVPSLRSAAPRPGRLTARSLAILGGAALVALAVSGSLLWRKPGAAPPGPVRRFHLDHKTGGAAQISPDGKHIAYVDGKRLRIRDLDRLESREIPGSENSYLPFWAPDGQSLAFFSGEFLKRAPVRGGVARTLCEVKPARPVFGAAWGPSGSIVVALGTGLGLYEVSAEGGELRPLLKPDPAKGIYDFHEATFLPDGRSLLLVVHPQTGFRFYLAVFDGREVRRILPESTPTVDSAVYSRSGHILFQARDGRPSLLALPFDASALSVRSEPVHLASDAGDPSVSADGVLVYRTGLSVSADLVLVDRSGGILRTISSGHDLAMSPRIAPDGKRVLFTESQGGNLDCWVEDIEQGTRVRLTAGSETDVAGAWSASGERVAIMSGPPTESAVVLMNSDGSGPAETHPVRANALPESLFGSVDWSPDARYVIYRSNGDLWVGDVTGKGAPVAFARTPFTETEGRFSPDGRYVAYASNESGRFEVYVRPFPAGDRKWTLSTNGGAAPRWSRRGGELFYAEGTRLMSVALHTRDGFRHSPPTELFDAGTIGATVTAETNSNSMIATFDPMPNAQGFAIFRHPPAGEKRLVIVENWAEELKKRP